jgi:O-antigen/teichoic acid export membrane protein
MRMVFCRSLVTEARGPRAVVTTAILNVMMAVASAITGLIIARALGPSGRGEYAAVVAWFGIALVAGELGQPGALCFYVASHSARGPDYISTARRFMIGSGVVTAVVGWFVAPLLGRNDATLVDCYRLMFATCVVSFVGASFVFPLQARDIRLWNAARAVQPILYVVGIVVITLLWRLTLLATIVTLVVTVAVQVVFAAFLCQRVNLLGGMYDRGLGRPLLRYGASQLAANAPTSVNGRLDQLILSTTTSFQDLGVYAVAVSVTSVATPVVSAIGSVLFPRIAAQKGASMRRLETRAVWASAIASVVIMLAVGLSAPLLLPLLYGHAYSRSIALVWILAIGTVFLGCGQVMGDLLRGRGQPLTVAVGQGIGAVVTVVLLVVLLPVWGIAGAAVASAIAYFVTFAVLLRALRRPTPPNLSTWHQPSSENDKEATACG